MAAKITKILLALIMAGALGWYAYDVFVNGTPYTENLLSMLSAVCVCLAGMLRSGRRYRKGLSFYENAYSAYIKNSFREDASARKKLIGGYRFYDEDALRKAERVAESLKSRCLNNGDREGVYLLSALVHTDMGLSRKAIEEYEELINRGVISTTIYNNLGQQYARCGERDRAMDSYSAAVNRDPGYAVGYNNMAQLHFREGDFDTAISLAEQALAADKSCYQASTLLAIIYALREDKALTERYSHMAVSAGQDPKDLKNAIAYFKSAQPEDTL